MAKYECKVNGNFDELIEIIDNRILKGSMSASFEDGSEYVGNNVRCVVRVYERYSMLGKNRVSLNVTLVEDGDTIFVSGVTSGGSQAVLFKLNTFGEETFLDCFIDAVNSYGR